MKTNSFHVGCELASSLIRQAETSKSKKVKNVYDDILSIRELIPESIHSLHQYDALNPHCDHFETSASVNKNGNKTAKITAYDKDNKIIANFQYLTNDKSDNPMHTVQFDDADRGMSCIFTTSYKYSTGDLKITKNREYTNYNLGKSNFSLKFDDENAIGVSNMYHTFRDVFSSNDDFFRLFSSLDLNNPYGYLSDLKWYLDRNDDIKKAFEKKFGQGETSDKHFAKFLKIIDIQKTAINSLKDPQTILNTKIDIIKTTTNFLNESIVLIYEELIKNIKDQINHGFPPFHPGKPYEIERDRKSHPLYLKFIKELTEDIKAGKTCFRPAAINEDGEFWGILDNGGGPGFIVKPVKDVADEVYKVLKEIINWKEPVIDKIKEMRNAVRYFCSRN